MNFEQDTIEGLESSIESWMLGNYEDAKENLGEDVVAAISEALDHE